MGGKLRLCRVPLLLILGLLGCAGARLGASPSVEPLQALVVVGESWNSVEASMSFWERENLRGRWHPVKRPCAAVVGRNGLGWGIGLHRAPPSSTSPVKQEGDGKAPAGVFVLSRAFGSAPLESVPHIRVPYFQATPSVQCVDDEHSEFYNRVVDTRDTAVRWKSHEEMLRQDGLYRWGLVVDHNAHPPIPGRGSCIFVHIWEGPTRGTGGCTALAASDLEEVLGWLDPAKNPVLVQLPRREYERCRKTLNLPPLSANPAKDSGRVPEAGVPDREGIPANAIPGVGG